MNALYFIFSFVDHLLLKNLYLECQFIYYVMVTVIFFPTYYQNGLLQRTGLTPDIYYNRLSLWEVRQGERFVSNNWMKKS